MRAALQIHALAGRIVGDHNADDRITVEDGDRRATGLASDPAMDYHHGRSVAKAGRYLLREIFERVLRLGEDEDLAPQTGRRIEHDRLVEDRREVAPFSILPRQLEAQSSVFEIRQDDDLRF